MLKTTTTTLLILFFSTTFNLLLGQEQLGWMNDNYSGVNGLDLQPANVVDSRFKFDMSLFHFNASLQNNYIGIRRSKIDSDNSGLDFKERALFEKVNSNDKSLYLNLQSALPIFNFMFNINRKNAIAFTTKARSMFYTDSFTPELAKQIWEELKFQPLWGTRLENQNLNINTMVWSEIGITYGREIFTIQDHYLKGSVRAKYLMGLAGGFLHSKNIAYEFKDEETLSLFNSETKYGLAENLNDDFYENYDFDISGNTTFGFDLGLVYEWRKDAAEKYKYDMDGKSDLWRKDKNKYFLKAGLSVLDIGRIKFDKSIASSNFNADIIEWDLGGFDIDGINSFNDTINDRFIRLEKDSTNKSFKMKLPTAISYQVDWNIWKYFYLNHTAYISARSKGTVGALRALSTYSFSPRFEHRWVGLGLPYSYQPQMDRHRIGLMLRLGPLVIGTDNLINIKSNEPIFGADVYIALKIPLLFKKPKDKDGDKVSNKKDKCKNEPGAWENRGCPQPDADGDGITDSDDVCPHEKGTLALNGCPDTDEDGIADRDDKCPNHAGPKENEGCPDRDNDTVYDHLDNCPDEAGPVENEGCPYLDADGDSILDKDDACPNEAGPIENKGCPYPDTDGDGLTDNLDECPQTPGPVENKGCPALEQKEQKIIEEAFKNLEFESGKAIIKFGSLDELKKLAELIKTKPSARLKLSGHTDSTGNPESNLILSKNRAEAVKNYLLKNGVSEEQINVEWFGDKQPIADNKTASGRALNRRVEMKLVFR